MLLKSPILIQDFEELEACLAAAESTSLIVNCITPPDSAWYAGPLYWQSMIEDARDSHPGTGFRLIVDCGEDAGLVMKALATGLQYILFQGEAEVAQSLAEMAQSYEAHLVEIVGEGLDLGSAEDKAHAAALWLDQHGSPLSAVGDRH